MLIIIFFLNSKYDQRLLIYFKYTILDLMQLINIYYMNNLKIDK